MNLPFLETMITQSCNLSCLGCTNYSDLRHAGYVPWSQGKQQIQAWLDRINIQEFGIIGGEPLINPEWREWVSGSRELMPEAQLRFTTNGLLLDRVPDMIDFFESIVDEDKKDNKYSSTELFNKFNDFVKANNFKVDYTTTKFGVDIKSYDGVEKIKTRTNNVINIDLKKLKEHLTSKFKIEFVDFIEEEHDIEVCYKKDEKIKEEDEDDIEVSYKNDKPYINYALIDKL
jgi:organic radical activating enzyme